MEEIITSIINGQRKQAVEQIKDSPYLLEDVFEELLSQNMECEIISMYRVSMSVGYIQIKG